MQSDGFHKNILSINNLRTHNRSIFKGLYVFVIIKLSFPYGEKESRFSFQNPNVHNIYENIYNLRFQSYLLFTVQTFIGNFHTAPLQIHGHYCLYHSNF